MTSYAAGFVRRGLSGTVMRSASEISGLSTPQIFLIVNLTLYAFIGLRIAMAYGKAPASVILFLFLPTSPAFLIWDRAIIGRKDTLLIAIAFAASLLTRHDEERANDLRFWLALSLVLAVSVLIHESFVFFVPLIVIATCVGIGPIPEPLALLKRVLAACSLPGALFLVLIALRQPLDLELLFDYLGPDGASLRAAGRASQADIGTNAWMGGGSICYLNTPISLSLRHVWEDLGLKQVAGSLIISSILLIATAAYFVFLTTGASSRGRTVLWVAFGLLATLPLYAIAIDWGRWLYVTTMIFAANLPPRDGVSRIREPSPSSFCAAIAVLSLATVPHTRSPTFTLAGLQVVKKAVAMVSPNSMPNRR